MYVGLLWGFLIFVFLWLGLGSGVPVAVDVRGLWHVDPILVRLFKIEVPQLVLNFSFFLYCIVCIIVCTFVFNSAHEC